MTEEEIFHAGRALIDWFKTQSITPAEAAIIMMDVIANQLVEQNKDNPDFTSAGAIKLAQIFLMNVKDRVEAQ